VNATIPVYAGGNRNNHEPRRPRKLLLHRSQVNKLIGAIQRQGRTVVPLQVYFNERGLAKLEIALALGKKAHDKRATIKERDWQRQRSRLLNRT
jgi:SsrA-binding protein